MKRKTNARDRRIFDKIMRKDLLLSEKKLLPESQAREDSQSKPEGGKPIGTLSIGSRFTLLQVDQSANTSIYTVMGMHNSMGLIYATDQTGWNQYFNPDDIVFPYEYGKEL